MKKYLSLGAFAAAVLFGGAGLLLPPQGEIDSSVLILVAQLLVLCATLLGIKDYRPSQSFGQLPLYGERPNGITEG